MKKILLLPLDERPCNYNYPRLMPGADYTLIMPPKDMMGDKKLPADFAKISEWLLENIEDVDCAIISLETLIYGGIVPSRLHNESENTLINRAKIIEKLRKLNLKMKLYLFQLIMRCPSYSSSDEEPDYYEECGEQIFLYGKYSHKQSLGILDREEKEQFEKIKATLNKDYLNDFIDRRKKNLAVLKHNLRYIIDGTCDYFIIPQDDAKKYGFTSLDQMAVREILKENVLHLKTSMYPSADDTGLILLARAINELNCQKPKFYVHYASEKAKTVIPWFEDRPLDETIKYHILSAGGLRVYSLCEADIVLAVSMGSKMCNFGDSDYDKCYNVERNLNEFTEFISYALNQNKIVAVCDNATANGSEIELINILNQKDLLLKISAYAGWNTSSNTIGTACTQAVLYFTGKDDKLNRQFLLLRYYEDLAYMAYVRTFVTENMLPSLNLNYFNAGSKRGKVSDLVKENIIKFMAENYPNLAKYVKDLDVCMPWARMFETELKLYFNE